MASRLHPTHALRQPSTEALAKPLFANTGSARKGTGFPRRTTKNILTFTIATSNGSPRAASLTQLRTDPALIRIAAGLVQPALITPITAVDPALPPMRRINTTPRQNWQASVEAAGLAWHTSLTPRTTRPGGAESSPYLSVCGPAPGAVRSGENAYWNESAFYEFTAKEIEALEAATNELAAMALSAVQHIIDNHRYDELGIPEHAIPLIEKSWHADSPSLYGRFDLAYDGVNPPKLLEYNADTPTSLLEAAVVQWYWL